MEIDNFQDFQDFAKREITFAKAHRHEDTARLLLSAARYPTIDMPLAVQQIEGLRTAAEKWPSLLGHEGFMYPPRLNREQASSEATARYKASLLSPPTSHLSPLTLADLTGGMGIDTLAFASLHAATVDYVERDPALCALMERNLAAMGITNVTVHCADSLEWLIPHSTFDILYLDPARRNAAGRKVAAFEDCTPDILQHLDLLRAKAQRLLIKASPMIDISLALRQLGTVSEVHIVAVKGECKEVLFIMGSPCGEPIVKISSLASLSSPARMASFSFRPSEEQTATATYCAAVGRYLYDPHAALRKAGCFRLLGQRLGLPLLAPNSHLYTSDEWLPDFPGRTFEVLQEVPLNRKAIREALPGGEAHVVVRNFPAEAAALQKQLGLREGGDRFLIATTVASRRLGLLCRLFAPASRNPENPENIIP